MHQIGRRPATQIARMDGGAVVQKAALQHAVEQFGHAPGGDRAALIALVAWMVGKLHRRDQTDLMSEPVEGECGGLGADMAEGGGREGSEKVLAWAGTSGFRTHCACRR